MIEIDRCKMPQEIGPCRAARPSWSYDQVADCLAFLELGDQLMILVRLLESANPSSLEDVVAMQTDLKRKTSVGMPVSTGQVG